MDARPGDAGRENSRQSLSDRKEAPDPELLMAFAGDIPLPEPSPVSTEAPNPESQAGDEPVTDLAPETLATCDQETSGARFRARQQVQEIFDAQRKSEHGYLRAVMRLPAQTSHRWMTFTGIALMAVFVGARVSLFVAAAPPRRPVLAPAPIHRRRLEAVPVINTTDIAPRNAKNPERQAIRDVRSRAELGDAQAQTELALSLLRGTGGKPDPLAAIRWSVLAAQKGEPDAQFLLGDLYAKGIKPDPARAFQWFSRAASRGNAKAMHNIAIAYLTGSGIAEDPAAAVEWFTKAAGLGYRDSAFDLAVLYERGDGVAQSNPNALRWYDRAASLGDMEAAQRARILRRHSSQIARE
jgi:hypothetical protein